MPKKERRVSLENLTETQREEAARWIDVLEDWERFRASFPGKPVKEIDRDFAALTALKTGREISIKTLYRKKAAYKKLGAGALADRRGRHGKHKRGVPEVVKNIFTAKYLDGKRPTTAMCAELTRLELLSRVKDGRLAEMPAFPSLSAFRRVAAEIPRPLIEYHRFGKKAYIERCEPYIRRLYDMDVNEFWVCDNHTFDVLVRVSKDCDKLIRPHLTAFLDARSRKIVGWFLTENPNSQATIYALRKGILECGKPVNVYADNGREFTARDVGGRGFRKRKNTPENEPTILKNLGINFTTAQVENARAKLIERAFRTVKERFSRLFDSYVGGGVWEKPDDLEKVVKNPRKCPTMEEFAELVDVYIKEKYNAAPHSGDGMGGKSPDEAFAELAPPKREVDEDELNLLLMRWSVKLKAGKNGVTLNICGKKLQYNSPELWLNHFGKAVYVRYDPERLDAVRIYGEDERFLCEAALDTPLGYKASKDEIQRKQAEKRAYTRLVRDYKNAVDKEINDNLSLVFGESFDRIMTERSLNKGFRVKVLAESKPRLAIAAGENLDTGGGNEDYEERFSNGLKRLKEAEKDRIMIY